MSHSVSYIILRETRMLQPEADIFLCENAEMFPHLQKQLFQLNSFTTESNERWTAVNNLHEYKRPHKTQGEMSLFYSRSLT